MDEVYWVWYCSFLMAGSTIYRRCFAAENSGEREEYYAVEYNIKIPFTETAYGIIGVKCWNI